MVVALEGHERSILSSTLWRMGQLTVPTLPTTGVANEWSHFVTLAHQSGFRGAGKRIAIIDTGCNLVHRQLANKIISQVNVTSERDGDLAGHGTVVSLLAHQVAPDAQIIIIKALDRTARGGNATTLATAIEKAAEHGAHIINISAGIHRAKISHSDEADDSDQLDPAGVCNCPVCRAAEAVAQSTGAAIFASAGNTQYRDDEYHWYCPALAADVIPVVGIDGEQAIARPRSAAAGVDSPGVVSRVRYERTPGGIATVAKFLPHPKFWRGSSFATPLVAGTAALVAQMYPRDIAPKAFFHRNIRDKSKVTTDAIAAVQYLFLGPDQNKYDFVPTEASLTVDLSRLAAEASDRDDLGRAIALWQVLVGLLERRYGPTNDLVVTFLLNMAAADLMRPEIRTAVSPIERMLWVKCAPLALSRAIAIRVRLQPAQLPPDVGQQMDHLMQTVDELFRDRAGRLHWRWVDEPDGPLAPLDWSRAGLPVYMNAL